LAGEVAGHEVDVVGEIFPGASHAGDLSLAAEFAFGADFASDAGDFASEGVELVDHGVDGVFQLENFTFDVVVGLAGKVAASDGGGDFGVVRALSGEVAGHRIHGVGQIFPSAGDAGHDGLAAEFAVGAYFASHASDFSGEAVKLVHHGVEGF